MEFKNDIGKPWRFEEGDYTVTRSSVWSPPGCHPTSCGVKFYVNSDGILKKVEGDENNPITNGRLCPRCLALKDYIYNPSRVINPMKRDPEDRGKDKWERISWDEAYDLIAEKTAYFKEKYGPESIVAFSGTGRDGGIMIQSYAHRMLGTPNGCYTQSGYACYIPRVAGTSYVLGAAYPEMDYAGGLPGRYDDPAFQLPEVIVVWGKEPLPSNGDGLFGHAVIDMMRRGSKLISIDPRLNWLSTRASLRLPLRPGTDAALAMAMLNIIITEGLYDHDFVDKWCYGFDEFTERVKTMSPEKAAEICNLDVDDIYAVARMYAKAKPAQIAWGLAVDQNPNGVQVGHGILALMAITGNLDRPGGQILGTPFTEEATLPQVGWNAMSEELQSKILGLKEYPAYVSLILNAHADLMLETLETDKPYPIKMGYISSTNILAPTNSAQPKRWHDALLRLEWTFATDCFITPTIQAAADLFLPLSTVAEHDGVTFTHYDQTPITVGAMSKAITVGECKSDHEIIFELGKKLMPELWDMYADIDEFINDERLRGHPVNFEQLRKEVVRQKPVEYYKYLSGHQRTDGQLGFLTPTGRVELYSTMFEQFGDDPLPYFSEPPYSPVSTPDTFKEYPFILTTGARTYAFFHSEHRQIPRLRELNPNPLLEINPADADKLGITDGQWVEIANQFGKAKLKAKVCEIVKPGVVHAQHGWWFPEEDAEEPSLFGVWKSNINELVPHKHVGRMGFGAPYKCNICKITPLAENLDSDMSYIWDKFGKLVM
ncbi:MAG: molybdopterin-dependent oxidoreductase [Coriobacteriia bacterium]|nr:molybdopterin-dependent oxidoreductase [Coriobacteriia bacterium]